MNTVRVNAEGKSKGEQVKEMVEAAIPPGLRDSRRVYITKENLGLTKVRISVILPERDAGGMAVQPD